MPSATASTTWRGSGRRSGAESVGLPVRRAIACLWCLIVLPAGVAPQVPGASPPPERGERPNRLTEAERAAGWRLLFDGRTLRGWRGLGRDSVPTSHWTVEDGTIKKIPSGQIPRRADGQPLEGGDLLTEATFQDFELTWEWKVAPGANSGLKYNVSEKLSSSIARHAAIGFEYQIIDDDRHEDGKLPSHRAGALYDLVPPNQRKALHPVGEWNRSTVILRGNHGEHWLNGEKILDFDLETRRMDSLLAASKYRSIAGFAARRPGHIVLQDHGDEVRFRNLRIRELDSSPH